MATQDKYDRQIRIWGSHGQEQLTNAHILLIGGDAVGVETLKNLVLPGVGHITIVDDKIITEKDVENNFFTPYEFLGQERGKIILKLLLEMNPDVSGIWLKEIPKKLDEYSLIIGNEYDCHESKVNVINLQTYGFFGRIRLFSPQCQIIETKPMGNKIDLRISDPFPEFLEFCNSFSFQGDQDEIAHIPYIVILRKALENYIKKNNKIPQSFYEKNNLFKAEINELGKILPYEYRGNFEEALQNMQQCFPVEDWKTEQEEISRHLIENTEFALLYQALDIFTKKHKNPPLQREFPDMKCHTKTYVYLKQVVYGNKSEKDFQEFKQILLSLDNHSDDDTIRRFIDNINNLKVIKYRTCSEEEDFPLKLEDFESDGYMWYAGLRALKMFQQTYQQYPKFQDFEKMQKLCLLETQRMGVNQLSDAVISELCRYEGCKLHNIAALIGGIASQEAVKLITNQFVPINNTLIFNGLIGQISLYEF